MKVVCLMPTYGRPPHLLENALKCFLDQNYEDKFLLIYDDLGNMTPEKHEKWQVIKTKERSPTLPSKYMFMLDFLDTVKKPWDAFCVWDDDDMYLPEHIELSVKAMQESPWSKPGTVQSTYSKPPGETYVLDATGRFHGSLAVTKNYFREMGGWPITKSMLFDQKFMAELAKHAPAGDYTKFGEPQYIFRWADTGTPHCSSRNGDPDWYQNYVPSYSYAIPYLVPNYDKSTQLILDNRLAASQME